MDSNTPFDGNKTSGDNTTLWTLTAPQQSSITGPDRYPPLTGPLETEVLVIGGGIAGLTTAYRIAQSGLKVTVVEDGFLGSGETSRTTAHLTYVLDERYSDIIDLFGEDHARQVGESHREAIAWIKATVEREGIDCHFRTIDGYLFTHPSDTEANLLKELDATQRIGIESSLLESVPGISGEEGKPAILLPGQGQLHSLYYIKGLAEAIIRMGGSIYTNSKALDISTEGATVNGHTVRAKHIVVATYTAMNDVLRMHTRQWPYRSYAIAAKVPKGKRAYALWWNTGNMDSPWITKPYQYARLEPCDDTHDFLLVGGEDHRTGQADDEGIPEKERAERLFAWALEHFPDMEEVVASWSGQILYSIDGLGFTGRNPGNDNIYIITGDSGNGMTYATIGAAVITDLINGKENPWATLYDPSRSIRKKTRNYLHELGNMVKQYADWLTPGDKTTLEDLKPGEGAVIRSGLKKLAVYRNEYNELHTCSAVCPHLGGIVQWNAEEKTFDCPLHGSRFTVEGTVLNGPANEGLKAVE